MDPECERPQNYEEYVSGDESWNKVGIRIRWTDPVIPGNEELAVQLPVSLRLCVEVKKSIKVDELMAYCWTPIITKTNPCGIWKEVRLNLCPPCSHECDCCISHVFETIIVPEKVDNYRVTFNVKWRNTLVWNNKFQKDNFMALQKSPCVHNVARHSCHHGHEDAEAPPPMDYSTYAPPEEHSYYNPAPADPPEDDANAMGFLE